MTLGDVTIQKFATLQTWKRKGERAPHKPLLTLLALGQLQRSDERLIAFTAWEPELKRLLIDFGPPRQSSHPEYPFWRLQADGVWEVQSERALTRRRSNSDPLKSELRARRALGGFTLEIYRTLKAHPEIVRAVGAMLLEAHFPSSLHASITMAVGLEPEATTRNSQRDANFRREVIVAWGHRCGFCGYDVRLDNTELALEAAHIRWVQAGGPDIVRNGICCCAIHHQALDRGALGVSDDLKVFVSANIYGGAAFESHFSRLHGGSLLLPSRTAAIPNTEYLQWHRKQVFKGHPRD